MNLLFSKEDLFNETGIDIVKALGTDNETNAVDYWLLDRQDEILDFISDYAYGGRKQAEVYASVYPNDIIKAIYKQVEYTLKNANTAEIGGILLHSSGTEKLSVEERLRANIAPRAIQILKNAGLLYRGRVC